MVFADRIVQTIEMINTTIKEAVRIPKTGVIWCFVGAAGLAAVEAVVLVEVSAPLLRSIVVRLWPPSWTPPVEFVSNDEVVPGWTPLPEVVEGPPVEPGTVCGFEVAD